MVSFFGTETSPSSGASSPTIIRNSVVLPDPFGPTSPTFSPGLSWNDASTKRTCRPYCLLIRVNETISANHPGRRREPVQRRVADRRAGWRVEGDRRLDRFGGALEEALDVGGHQRRRRLVARARGTVEGAARLDVGERFRRRGADLRHRRAAGEPHQALDQRARGGAADLLLVRRRRGGGERRL